VTVLFYNAQGFFVGPAALHIFHDQPADLSSVVGILVSLGLFLAFARIRRGPARRAQTVAAPT